MKTTATEAENNVIPLPANRGVSPVAPPPAAKQRFKVIPFLNAGGTKSWRVIGTNRHGKQIRENFANLKAAQCRQVELMADYYGRQGEDTSLRATKLTETQLRIAEACFVRLDADDDMYLAVDHWLKHGKQHAVAESPRIDDAVKKFKKWLDDDSSCTLRDHSRSGLRLRVGIFGNSIGNLRVSEITPDTIEDFLGKLTVSGVTKDNYRRAVSRFFSWCIERPRRWTVVNPCREIRVAKAEKGPPCILTVAESKSLLQAAEAKGLAPYVAVCLFGGLRPFEASRLSWDAVNLKDREIRLEGTQTKTGTPRVIAICPTLNAWLQAHKNKPFFPANWRRDFDAIKEEAGLIKRDTAKSESTFSKKKKGKLVQAYRYWKKVTPINWVPDILRHTAISHYCRRAVSYVDVAKQFGNSEAIIRKHYEGRVSSDDTKKFYELRPTKR